MLHHHHELEDEFYLAGDAAPGRRARRRRGRWPTLAAMEAEHEQIDPALAACEAGLATMAAHPCPDHRDRLDVDVTRTRAALLDHLRHEETEAIPLMQRILPADDWEPLREGRPVRPSRSGSCRSCVGWGLHGLPADAAARMTAIAGPGYVLVHRLVRRGWERRERRTFRYA